MKLFDTWGIRRRPDAIGEKRLTASEPPSSATPRAGIAEQDWQAIDLADRCPAGNLGQARAFFALDRPEDAADSLEIALAMEPRSLEALRLLARIRQAAGDLDDALALLSRARSLAPGNPAVLLHIGLVLNRCGHTERAMKAYREAIESDPSDPAPRVNLGLIHLQQLGDPCSAEAHFRAALSWVPDSVEAAANLGLALHDQGCYAEEFEVYRRALSAHPESTELRWHRALAQLSVGDFRLGWEGYELRFSRRGGRPMPA
jgi:tetratricopeptide (TPR) repeat protein